MCRLTMGRISFWTLFITSCLILEESQASEPTFRKMCSNRDGTFSMSNPESVAALIREGEILTAFVNDAPEFVFQCKCNHYHDPTNKSWQEIKFESSSYLNRQINSYGEFIHPGTMRRNLSTSLMRNDGTNRYNKENQTISCMVDNEVICRINVIVIVEKVAEICTIPTFNGTQGNISALVEKVARTAHAISQLDCKLDTHLINDNKRSCSVCIEPARKFSVFEKGEWFQCSLLDQNNTKLDVRFKTTSDIQKIRCPFIIDANARNTKAYLIRVEANYKSAIAAAIPMLAPPNEVQYSFFSVHLSDSVLQQDHVPAKKEAIVYPIWVPILTSLIMISVVLLIVTVVIKLKCFRHTIMCYKDDLEYKNDEEMDEYPTQSLNQDKCITQKYYFNNDYMRSDYSGYSDTTSMMTTSTDLSVSYLDASGRPHNCNRLISEIMDLDERNSDLKQFIRYHFSIDY